MTFLRPEMLWIATAVVPLVILHLRWRRRRVEVASLTVWHEVVQMGAGRSGLRRVREVLALLASVLAVLAIAVAAAEPVTGREPPPGVAYVIVLDASLTMSARDGSRFGSGSESRFSSAVGTSLAALASLAPQDDVTVWVAGARPRVLIGPTADVPRVEARLHELSSERPTLGPRTLGATVDAARRALALRDQTGVLLVLTDAPDAVPADAERPAIVAASGPPPGEFRGNGTLRELTVEGATHLLATVTVAAGREIVVRHDGREIARATVQSGDETNIRLPLPPGVTGLVTAELIPADVFPADDSQSVVLATPRPLAVVVRAPRAQPSSYLLAALAALPDGRIDRSRALLTDLDAGDDVLAAADVVITESGAADAAPRPVPSGVASLTFGSEGPEVLDPRLAAVAGHPVTQGVTAGPVRAPSARLLVLRPGETAVLSCDDGAAAARAGGARHVRVGLLPAQGTFALEGAFPVLVRNALVWLRDDRALPPAVRAGEPLSLGAVVPEGVTSVEIHGPAGTRTVRTGQGAALPVAERDAGGGVLTVHVAGDPEPLAVTAVQWTPRPGTRLERGPGGQDADAALAALPRRVAVPPRRHHGAPFALGAALLALVGGLLVGRTGGAGRTLGTRKLGLATPRLGLRSQRPRSQVP